MTDGEVMFMDDFKLDDILNPKTIVKIMEYDPNEIDDACHAFLGCYLANLNPEMHTEEDGTIILRLTIKE